CAVSGGRCAVELTPARPARQDLLVDDPDLAEYQGRRRAPVPGTRPVRGAVLVVGGLGAAVLVVLSLVVIVLTAPQKPRVPPVGQPALVTAPVPADGSSPTQPSPSAPGPDPSPSRSPSRSAGATPAPSRPPVRPPAPAPVPALQPLTYEAEAPGNVLS